MALSLSLSTLHSVWWYSEYPYTHHSLSGGTQNTPIIITVSLVVLRISLCSSQFPWWYSDYTYTHHSLPGGSKTIPLHITVSLVALRLSLHTSVSLVILILFLYSSQPPWWYLGYPYTHHSLSGGTRNIPILTTVYLVAQTIPILITVSLAVPRLSLFSSQSAWWYSDYQYTHHSLTGGTQTIPILISLPGDTHTILVFITAALVVLGLSLYSSQSLWWSSVYP